MSEKVERKRDAHEATHQFKYERHTNDVVSSTTIARFAASGYTHARSKHGDDSSVPATAQWPIRIHAT